MGGWADADGTKVADKQGGWDLSTVFWSPCIPSATICCSRPFARSVRYSVLNLTASITCVEKGLGNMRVTVTDVTHVYVSFEACARNAYNTCPHVPRSSSPSLQWGWGNRRGVRTGVSEGGCL